MLRTEFYPSRTILLVALIAALTSLAVAPLASAKSKKTPKPAGLFVTETNDPSANALVVFNRAKNGKLTQRQSIKTGGKGTTQNVGCGDNCPILDSSGAVDMTSNGKLVFAVNGGSDTITSFRVTGRGLKRVDTESSGGDLPNSVVARDGLLYVLNTTSGNIYGLRYSSTGKMTQVPNSSKPTAGQGQNQIFPSGGARQIGFDNTGDWVVVTELASVGPGGPPPGLISSFKLNGDGTTGPAVSAKSATPLPFGFAFDDANHMVVSEVNDPTGAADGSTSSYNYDAATGTPAPVSTLTSGGSLPCWVSLTKDGQHAFTINTGAGRPAGAAKYDIGSNGALTANGVTAAPAGTFLWTDPAQSADSKYLYVLAPTGPMNTKKSHVDSYKISSSGGLKFIGSTKKNLSAGVSGLDGR